MRRSLLGAFLGLLVVCCATASPAAAANYCVAPNTTCGGTNVASLQLALGMADNATDADRIFLGAATYTAPSTAGYEYNAAASPVTLVGAGRDQTILTSPSGATRVMLLFAGAASVISDLTVRLPMNTAGSGVGLHTLGVVRRVAVTSDPTQVNSPIIGVHLAGGRFEDGSVSLPTSFVPTSTGVLVAPGSTGLAVARSTIRARTGVSAQSSVSLERLDLTGVTGVEAAGGSGTNTVTLRSSVVRIQGGSSTALGAFTQAGGNVVLNADGLTIVGDGPAGGLAVWAFNFGDATSATVNLTNSIIRYVGRSFSRSAPDGSGGATITVTYSDYDPAATVVSAGPGTLTPTAGMLSPGNNVHVDPLFAGPADFHLQPASGVIDLGDPATTAGFDLDGNPLVVDGNGDGVARRDMGAFERAAPGPPGVGGGPAADLLAPVIGGFRADPPRFAVASRAKPARARRGTRFRYVLDEAAGVSIEVQRILPGRRVGGRCRKPTKRNRSRARCKRFNSRGRIPGNGELGANATAFGGRLNGRALRRGRYRAVIGAIDNAGNRSRSRTTRFRVVRSRTGPAGQSNSPVGSS